MPKLSWQAGKDTCLLISKNLWKPWLRYTTGKCLWKKNTAIFCVLIAASAGRASFKRISQEIALDFQNITSHKNILLQNWPWDRGGKRCFSDRILSDDYMENWVFNLLPYIPGHTIKSKPFLNLAGLRVHRQPYTNSQNTHNNSRFTCW